MVRAALNCRLGVDVPGMTAPEQAVEVAVDGAIFRQPGVDLRFEALVGDAVEYAQDDRQHILAIRRSIGAACVYVSGRAACHSRKGRLTYAITQEILFSSVLHLRRQTLTRYDAT